VYDYEIKSLTPVQTIPVKAYIQTYRPPPQKLNQSMNASQQIMINTPQPFSSISSAATPLSYSSNIMPPTPTMGMPQTPSKKASMTQLKNGLDLITSNITNMGQQLYGSSIGTGSTAQINNMLIDDLNALNATNQNFAAALLFQQSNGCGGGDPMLAATGPAKINESSSPTTILGVLNAFNSISP
jgi:hypothetical protein